MKVRSFGVLLLMLVGVVPLATAGWIMLRRAERTALEEVRVGDQRVAARAATRLRAYVDAQLDILRTVGASASPAVRAAPAQLERMLKNYRITFRQLRALDLIGSGSGCREIATSRLDGQTRERCGEPAVEEALAGRIYRGDVRLSDDFAPLMTVGMPLEAAGERVGAVVAQIDLVGIWEAVNEIHVGESGHARLVSADGTLIAHGDPEERRRVFMRERDPFADAIRGAPAEGTRYRDSQGRYVLAVAAPVPDLGWTVIVEQPESEAYAAARAMRRDLALVVLAGAVLAVVVGLLVGRAPVRAIEAMKRHAADVAHGKLDTRLELPRLAELGSLASALNRMSAELARLQEEIRARERLSTFARVAAGLAHDLQTPIESIRAACDLVTRHPDDAGARDLFRSATANYLPRLSRYVRDLRRLAHEGEVSLDLSAVDAVALARRVADIAAAEPKWNGVTFAIEGEVAPILADESLIERALINLVGNAADACVARRPPGGRVVLRLRDGAGALAIDVVDNGVGIPATILEELLLNDFKSTKRNSGVGLGLAVARHIAEGHAGAITAASESGAGSTFTLILPRSEAAGGDAPSSAIEVPGEEPFRP